MQIEYICGCYLFRLWSSGLHDHCGQILTVLMDHTAFFKLPVQWVKNWFSYVGRLEWIR
jgi:hypothetical protein